MDSVCWKDSAEKPSYFGQIDVFIISGNSFDLIMPLERLYFSFVLCD